MKFPINHDLHCHSYLSLCSNDKNMTPQAILNFAEKEGYDTICITDHFWDSFVDNPSDFYKSQDLSHVQKSLPLPKSDKVRFVFGCETEFCGGNRLAISKENFDKFDFIIIPPNHFHMKDFVRSSSVNTEEKIAELLVERLEQITLLDLPWKKIGIAHINDGLTFNEGDFYKVFRIMDEVRLNKVFRFFAENGCGIELNGSCFPKIWKEHEHDLLRLFKIAHSNGCKFYCGSDAHGLNTLNKVLDRLDEVSECLGLTEENLYTIP